MKTRTKRMSAHRTPTEACVRPTVRHLVPRRGILPLLYLHCACNAFPRLPLFLPWEEQS